MTRFACWLSIAAASFAIATAADIHCTDVYSTRDCSGVPDHFRIIQRRPCALSDSMCEPKEVFNETEYDVCSSISDPQTHAAEIFGDVPYMLTSAFNDNNCDECTGSFAYRADGSCLKIDEQSSQLLILNGNGSVTWKKYAGVVCEDEDVSSELLYVVDDNYTCTRGGFIYFNNEYPGTNTAASVIRSIGFYSTSDCKAAPDVLYMTPQAVCQDDGGTCEDAGFDNQTEYKIVDCVSDQYVHAAEKFDEVPYVLTDVFEDSNCDVYKGSMAHRANGDCLVLNGEASEIVVMNTNGSATLKTFMPGEGCDDQDLVSEVLIDTNYFENPVCQMGGFIFYNNAYPGTESSSSGFYKAGSFHAVTLHMEKQVFKQLNEKW